MSYHNQSSQQGFTLVEMVVVLVLISIVGLGIYSFTTTASVQYLNLHADGLRFSELTEKSQRISRVLRGAGDLTEAGNNSLTAYGYFSPADQYYSIVRYYVSPDKTQLMADVTPLTANPPIGTPITSQKKTFVVVDNFYDDPTLDTFQYLDSSGTAYPLPIADLHTVKGIRINLATATKNSPQTTKTSLGTQVTLRNRKTNL